MLVNCKVCSLLCQVHCWSRFHCWATAIVSCFIVGASSFFCQVHCWDRFHLLGLSQCWCSFNVETGPFLLGVHCCGRFHCWALVIVGASELLVFVDCCVKYIVGTVSLLGLCQWCSFNFVALPLYHVVYFGVGFIVGLGSLFTLFNCGGWFVFVSKSLLGPFSI